MGSSKISAEKAVAFFVEGLGDPYHPKYCEACFTGCLDVIQPEIPGTPTNKSHSFWNTVIAFVTAQRSSDDLSALQIQLSKSRCDPLSSKTRRRLHNLGIQIISSFTMLGTHTPFALFVMKLFTAIEHAVKNVNEVVLAKRAHKSWPSSPQDLIPFGAETTIASVDQWLVTLPAPVVLPFLGHLVRLCRYLVIPTIVSSRSLASDLTNAFREVCNRAKIFQIGTDIHVYPADRDYLLLTLISSFIENWRGVESTVTSTTNFFRGHQNELIHLCSDALHITTCPFISEEDKTAMDHATVIFVRFSMCLIPFFTIDYRALDLHPYVVRARDNSIGFQKENPLYNLFARLQESKTTHLCSARGCPNTFQSSGKSFGRCGRCRVVSYCGAECQKSAWTDGDRAHRDVCKTLQKFNGFGLGDFQDYDKFEECCRLADITAEDEDVVELTAWLTRWWHSVDLLDRPGPYIPGPDGI